jgi:hypothetical protein
MLPGWLVDGTWQATGESIKLSGRSVMDLYTREYEAGRVVLGGHCAAGGKGTKNNYLVIVTPSKSLPQANSESNEGPLGAEEWLSQDDSDGDGLTDRFELSYGVDSELVDTDNDMLYDEYETGPDGRTLWDIQEYGVEKSDDKNDSDEGSGGCIPGADSSPVSSMILIILTGLAVYIRRKR